MQLVRPEAVYIGAEFHRFRRDRYCFLIENCSPPPKPALMFKRLDGCDSMPDPNPNPNPNPNPYPYPNPIQVAGRRGCSYLPPTSTSSCAASRAR